jgi:UPF0176 protein
MGDAAKKSIKKSVLNVAFYHFFNLPDSAGFRPKLRALCSERLLRGTIILSPEGINGFLAGTEVSVRSLLEELRRIPGLETLTAKESWSDGNPFARMKVKLKAEIIPMGQPTIQPARLTGQRLAPKELKRWLDEGRDILLLDTRNRYEIEHGTFEGALDLGIGAFREFSHALGSLPETARNKPVVMFCTGGIRCEKASAFALQEAGYENVWQLEGGILKYFEDCGPAHYRGDCFVFDERETLDPDLAESRQLSSS